MAMIVAAGFIDWNLRFGRDNTIRSQLGHIQLVREGFMALGRSDPGAYLLGTDPAIDAAVSNLPTLISQAPRLLISGLASSGDQTLSFIGEGVSPEAEAAMSSGLRFPQGRNLQPGEPQTAIVGEGLASNLGLTLDDMLVLITNTDDGGISAVEARVVGIFNSIAKAYDDVALRIPIALARELTRHESEHLRLILLDDVGAVAPALAQLRTALPDSGYELVPWYELADFYNKTAALFKKQVSVIYVIIALVMVLSVSNTMTMSVVQRIGEIGTMMAMGTRRRQILLLFVAEGLMLGLAGTLIGIVVGILVGAGLSAIGIPMPPGPGMTWGYEAGVLISAHNVAIASAIAIVTSVLASLYPAWRASRLDIVDALRSLT